MLHFRIDLGPKENDDHRQPEPGHDADGRAERAARARRCAPGPPSLAVQLGGDERVRRRAGEPITPGLVVVITAGGAILSGTPAL